MTFVQARNAIVGGLDEEIAKAIYRRKAGVIETYSNIMVPVITASG